jgi:cytochrome c556
MAAMMSRGAALAVAVGIGAAITASGALASDPMPKNASAATKAAYARHENFEKLGKTFKVLNDELKKSDPDKAVIAAATKTMVGLATALPGWFPRGSGVQARPMSEAKAEIWTDAAGFSAASSAMQVQVSKLNQAALSGDIAAVKAQVRPTGGTCKGCHDKYRVEKKS